MRGTLAELAALRPPATRWLRVYVREPPRAGLREEVQALLPQALEVRIDPEMLPDAGAPSRPRAARPAARRASCSPTTWPAAGTPTTASRDLFDELLRAR